MTNGDKIKLRAELAGKAMQGILSRSTAADFSHLSGRDDFERLTYGESCCRHFYIRKTQRRHLLRFPTKQHANAFAI